MCKREVCASLYFSFKSPAVVKYQISGRQKFKALNTRIFALDLTRTFLIFDTHVYEWLTLPGRANLAVVEPGAEVLGMVVEQTDNTKPSRMERKTWGMGRYSLQSLRVECWNYGCLKYGEGKYSNCMI